MKKLLCLLLALFLTACGSPQKEAPDVTGSLEVRFTDLGARITCNEETTLIATVAKAEALNQETADILVLTQMPDTLPKNFKTIYTPESRLPESISLGGAQVRFFPMENELALEVRFGEQTFLFLGKLSPEGQDMLISQWPEHQTVDLLSVSGGMEPQQTLLETIQPQYVLVAGKSVAHWPDGPEVFETAAFGSVTMTTDGQNLDIRWGLQNQDDVAA